VEITKANKRLRFAGFKSIAVDISTSFII